MCVFSEGSPETMSAFRLLTVEEDWDRFEDLENSSGVAHACTRTIPWTLALLSWSNAPKARHSYLLLNHLGRVYRVRDPPGRKPRRDPTSATTNRLPYMIQGGRLRRACIEEHLLLQLLCYISLGLSKSDSDTRQLRLQYDKEKYAHSKQQFFVNYIGCKWFSVIFWKQYTWICSVPDAGQGCVQLSMSKDFATEI